MRAIPLAADNRPELIDITALLDTPQPEIVDLLSRVRVQLGAGPAKVVFSGQIIARAFPCSKAPMLYDVLADGGFRQAEVPREAITVLAVPSAEDLAAVIRLADLTEKGARQ